MKLLSKISFLFSRFSSFEKKAFFALLLIGSFGVAGLSGQAYTMTTIAIPEGGGIWREGMVGEPTNLNPALPAISETDQSLRALLHAGLLGIDTNGNFTPVLAESLPEVSPDLTVYTVHLRQNIQWHDGAPITSEDVAYTVRTIQSKDYGSHLRSSFRFIKVETPDQYTVVFTLRDPNSAFYESLLIDLLPQHQQGQADINPIGAGPYRIKKVSRTFDNKVDQIDLEANALFQPKPPMIEQVSIYFYTSNDEALRALKRGDIDGLGLLPQASMPEAPKGIRTISLPLAQYQALFLNKNTAPILNSPAIRKALSLSVSQNEIVAESYGGAARPATTPFVQEPQTGSMPYDPTQAVQLLESEGWVSGPDGIRTKNGTRLTLTINTNETPLNSKTAELVAEGWRKLGIETTVAALTNDALIENVIVPRSYQVLLLSESIGHDPDPFAFWHSSQIKDPGLNLSGFNNARADALIVKARGTLDPAIRADAFKQFGEIINQELPALFLVQPHYTYYVRENMQGMANTNIAYPSERFQNIEDWFVKVRRELR